MAQEIKMSAAGLKAMQEELEYLKTVRRKAVANQLFAHQRPHAVVDDQERRHH